MTTNLCGSNMEFYTEFWEQNDYLKKVKIALENECTFCRQNIQTIKHLPFIRRMSLSYNTMGNLERLDT